MNFREEVNFIRKGIKGLANSLDSFGRDVARNPAGTLSDKADPSEVVANLKLAYRHLEDASMRLGKAMQAEDGGVSVYDRDTTVGA